MISLLTTPVRGLPAIMAPVKAPISETLFSPLRSHTETDESPAVFLRKAKAHVCFHCHLTDLIKQSPLELTRNMYLDSYLLPVSPWPDCAFPPHGAPAQGRGGEASALNTCIRSWRRGHMCKQTDSRSPPAREVLSTSPRFLLCRPLMVDT